ncbi:MAG: hypothetical protein ACLQU5_04075 [Isosphaeraceae bacterium]
MARSTPGPAARLTIHVNVPITTPARVSNERTFCWRRAEAERPRGSAVRIELLGTFSDAADRRGQFHQWT